MAIAKTISEQFNAAHWSFDAVSTVNMSGGVRSGLATVARAVSFLRCLRSPCFGMARKVSQIARDNARIRYDGVHEMHMPRALGFLTGGHVDLYRVRGVGRAADVIFSDNWNRGAGAEDRIGEMIDALAPGGILVLDFSTRNRNFGLISPRYRLYLEAVLTKSIAKRFGDLGKLETSIDARDGRAMVFRKSGT